MAVHVYSITFKDHPLRLDDLDGVGTSPARLRTVSAGPLCAVVSDAPGELPLGQRDIDAHQEVQKRLMADGTVLPLKFGCTAPDDEAVRSALETRADEFADRLGRLEGCVEYNLKASQDEEMLLREILSESEAARRLNDRVRDGTADPTAAPRLGELVAVETRARQEALASGVIEALRPFAREIDAAQPDGADFLSVSFLVNEEQDELFLATELSLAHQMGEGFDFRLDGPLPPYSFS
ncbi:GvpL/GvpF family gas vesicle protein [Streptomyces rhizosphaerihabitans]|uniref:GvpL/GvpF family gas vesicle protein n=1 Tax=Streptomyces rhizosphaerihabitans TaxID=1266770 RepID=UPI0021BED384|nr:GvpL/GvpF family gas vesicle protein [Streptomyces rhizosphaerihabitans]MCT9007671.1 GvpL/GvpF family gas vesicle protein [Streptomyces rhizosphaerihabitans]